MKVLHGFYNMDENRVELTYSDGSVLMIDCEEVENFYHVTAVWTLSWIAVWFIACRTVCLWIWMYTIWLNGAVWQN